MVLGVIWCVGLGAEMLQYFPFEQICEGGAGLVLGHILISELDSTFSAGMRGWSTVWCWGM